MTQRSVWGAPEEELGTVAGDEGLVAPPLLLLERVQLPLELGERLSTPRLRDHLHRPPMLYSSVPSAATIREFLGLVSGCQMEHCS